MPPIPIDILVLALAIALDLIAGELPNRFHPTSWIGRTIALAEKLAPHTASRQLIYGTLMVVLIPGLWGAAAFLLVAALLRMT